MPAARERRHLPLLLYGAIAFVIGMAMYLAGILLALPHAIFGGFETVETIAGWLVWYSGIPVLSGILLALFDLLVLFERKKPDLPVRFDPVRRRRVTVALTSWNDEDSIAGVVQDFLVHPLVERIIVVSNNSTDRTFERAEAAGAIVFDEPAQGYGHCVYRCLSEAVRFTDTDYVVLCEGDSTFRAYDIEKLLAYAPHADIVNGTRTVEVLRQYLTQLSTFIYYGNIFVGKLMEAKHLGRSTITDVGTTYKLCHRDALARLLPHLNARVNLEFNAHILDTALSRGLLLVECPITFHPRIGISKGGNVNNWRGLQVGVRMIVGLLSDWRYA